MPYDSGGLLIVVTAFAVASHLAVEDIPRLTVLAPSWKGATGACENMQLFFHLVARQFARRFGSSIKFMELPNRRANRVAAKLQKSCIPALGSLLVCKVPPSRVRYRRGAASPTSPPLAHSQRRKNTFPTLGQKSCMQVAYCQIACSNSLPWSSEEVPDAPLWHVRVCATLSHFRARASAQLSQ